MKILVLGASSFSGRWFSDVARSAGHQVLGLSRPLWDLNSPGLAVVEAIDAGYDVAVNYAALNVVAESWKHAADYYRTNVVGVARLAEQLKGVRKFVQVSTPEVYGTTNVPLTEDAPHSPSTPYAASRSSADTYLGLLHRQNGFPVAFTRTVNIYGPGQQLYRIIPKTALCALLGRRLPLEGGGVSTRSFLHVRDAAAATLRVLEDGRPGQVYHTAHPDQVRIWTLVDRICTTLGKKIEDVAEDAPERPGKDMNYRLDDSKIRTELGWRAMVSIPDGLTETLEWVRSELPKLRTQSTDYVHEAAP